MPSLKEIRNRINSVSSTMQITSAMKMVSAAKLRRAQDAILQLRPYAQKLKEIHQNISAGLDAYENPFSANHSNNSVLIIPITSNRGLAGPFNSNIIKKTKAFIESEGKGKRITVLPIGKKAYDYFRKTEYIINGTDLPSHANHLVDKTKFDDVAAFTEILMNVFLNKQFERIVIIYNQFKNPAVQIPVVENFLPVNTASDNGKTSKTEYDFEPQKEKILSDLIPRSLKTQIYKAVLDSLASEHGARMTAMHKATDNAKELQRELKITYNKARQASITKEILEIVAGAEALNS
ncbi:MAG: ATP synthase F1 subunit gamma [Bacteroidia bacterium]|nr:ATP synthase F1 subunit gamma [Bacteroidia bacterium]